MEINEFENKTGPIIKINIFVVIKMQVISF